MPIIFFHRGTTVSIAERPNIYIRIECPYICKEHPLNTVEHFPKVVPEVQRFVLLHDFSRGDDDV